MITAFRNLRIRLRTQDEGIALILVIGVSLILMLLVTVALSVSLSGLSKSKNDESFNGAIAAAYAGIEDYKSKIADDNGYYRYGNPASTFSAANSPVSILPTGTAKNDAFGVGTGANSTWAKVAGSDASFYRYEVDSSKYTDTGVLRVRATGRVGNVTRSVVANLKQKGFIDFLYYTTYEISDPVITGANVNNCVKYWYEGRPNGNGSTNPCGDLSFGTGDVVNGPMHSNDAIRACGATFNGAVTTAYKPTSGKAYLRYNSNYAACSATPAESFPKGLPATVKTLDLPPTNGKMKNEVRTDLTEVQRPGCLYTGPTRIVFNSDGTMTVRSPWTKAMRVVGDPATGASPAADCGTVGTGTNQLGNAAGQKITVPPRNLIFVQNVVFKSTLIGNQDPNAWLTGTYPAGYSALTCAAGNGLGYPRTNEYVASIATSYGCSNGDVFLEGTVNAEVTVNAENYMYVTGDVTYAASNSSAILGLVAQNAVWIYNPVRLTNGTYTRLLPQDREIDAAILSVAHTFTAQNYSIGGDAGTITVNGAIAQLFRGPMRSTSGNTVVGGFAKNYNYDDRLRYVAPPKFLSPVSTTYGINVIVEVKTAFAADGSKI